MDRRRPHPASPRRAAPRRVARRAAEEGSVGSHLHGHAGGISRLVRRESADARQDRPGFGRAGSRRGRPVRGDRDQRSDPYVRDRAGSRSSATIRRARLTQNQLRVAGHGLSRRDPARYLQIPEGAVGSEGPGGARRRPRQDSADDNPFDVATTMVTELHSNRFKYDTNVADVDCGDRSVAECFAFSRRGFCQQYATPDDDSPAGARDPGSLRRRASSGHRQPADRDRGDRELECPRLGRGVLPGATAGSSSIRPEEAAPRSSHCRSGGEVDGPSPRPSRSVAPNDGRPDPERTPGAALGPTTPTNGPGGAGAFIIIALLLVGVVGAVAFAAWQRGPRGATTPDGAYDGVARLAGASRIRAPTDADRVRVRRGAGRRPAEHQTRASDRGYGQGRGRLWPADARRRADQGAARLVPPPASQPAAARLPAVPPRQGS